MKQIYNDPEARNIAVWLLEDARILIEHRVERHICTAIRDTARKSGSPIAYQVAFDLRAYVMQAIKPEPTYEGWLYLSFQGWNFEELTTSVLCAGRVAWIKDMIAALEKGEALPARPSLPPGFAWPEPKPVKFNLWEK